MSGRRLVQGYRYPIAANPNFEIDPRFKPAPKGTLGHTFSLFFACLAALSFVLLWSFRSGHAWIAIVLMGFPTLLVVTAILVGYWDERTKTDFQRQVCAAEFCDRLATTHEIRRSMTAILADLALIEHKRLTSVQRQLLEELIAAAHAAHEQPTEENAFLYDMALNNVRR